MKKILIATAICAAVSTPVLAEIPKLSCGSAPEYPGKLAMQSDTRAKTFRKELETYKDCVNAYVQQRTADSKANTEAANDAINQYNEAMKKVNTAQTEANKD